METYSQGVVQSFQGGLICKYHECSFCSMLREQIEGEELEGRPWLRHLDSAEGREGEFPVDKSASDHSKAWFSA